MRVGDHDYVWREIGEGARRRIFPVTERSVDRIRELRVGDDADGRGLDETAHLSEVSYCWHFIVSFLSVFFSGKSIFSIYDSVNTGSSARGTSSAFFTRASYFSVPPVSIRAAPFRDANVDYVKASTILNITVTAFVESVICIILGYGGWLVHEGVFNAGQLVEFIGYFTAIVWPIMAVSQLIEMQSRGKASLGRITELLDTKPEMVDKPDVEDVPELRGGIEFRDLTFRYPGGEFDVLKNVSFTIKPGENVGIIGRTGSGKTTLVDLLLRTYNVPDGTIFLDGHDINSLPIKTVRKYAAYVPQDNFLFSDTIENNISFATDGGNFQAIETAAKNADVHENITGFGLGYKTVLGERGVTVSGGQKQRISIARALMKDAAILILDDSVSAVDVSTEKVILDNLKKNRAGKTTILIAHRITTVEGMDKIIFIDDGKIAAVGTHAELIDTCRDYREMVELQRLNDAGDSPVSADSAADKEGGDL